MSMEQGSTRFRSMEEEEDDAVIQMAYARTRLRKNKGLVYLICVILGLTVGVLMPFGLGATVDPFLYPIWPLLFMPLLFGIIGLAVGMFINYRVVSMAENEMDRANDIKRFSNGALMVMIVGLVFTVLFGSIAFSPWLTDVVDKEFGTYVKPVMGKQAQDFELTPNDPLYIVHGSLDVRVLSNNTTCDFFVSDIGAFDKVNDTENMTQIEGASLPHGYAYNKAHYIYDGKDFKQGKSYDLRVYNFRTVDDINVKIKVHRAVDEFLLWGLLVLCVMFVAVGGVGFGMMQALRVSKPRPAAQPAAARAPPSRDAATMFKDMEEEVQTLFPARPAGAQPQRGAARPGQPRPGWGQTPGRPGPRAGPPGPGEYGARPGAPAREIAVERPAPQGVQKSIVCPRCRNRFTYVKIEGQVTDIQCPNCGKRGRVGAKAAPPTPAPIEEAALPTRRPPPRPATEPRLPPRPAGPTRPPRPAPAPKPAASPLDEIIGAPKPAGGKTKTLACPKCKQKFTVVEKPRPFEIKCPHCGKTGMLR